MRKAALVGLAYLGGPGLQLARPGLLETDRELQDAVAVALVEQGDPGISAVLDVLPKLSGDRMALLEAMATRPMPARASAALQQILQQGGAEAAAAADLLGTMKASDAEEVLLKALGDRTSMARRSVLTALGKIGDAKATETVARDLYHDSPEVRAAAAEALAHLGGAVPTEVLEALKGDYYRRVRESAQLALGRTVSSAPGEK